VPYWITYAVMMFHICIYHTFVMSVLFYAGDTSTLLAANVTFLAASYQKCYFSKHNQMLYIESAKSHQDSFHVLPSVIPEQLSYCRDTYVCGLIF